MVKAAIVTKSKFVSYNHQKFQGYIDYIDREEATRTKYFNRYNLLASDGYNRYMENPEKSSGLFTENCDSLDREQRKKVKKIFEQAQQKESILWQDVVSFDTNWLIQQGLYDPLDQWLDESKIRLAIRLGMREHLRDERLEVSAFWTAAIHYNELHHIHVHIAMVEPNPTREYKTFTRKDGSTYQARRGYRSKKSVNQFKSRVINQLMDRDDQLAQISALVRKGFYSHKGKMGELPDSQLQYLYQRIYQGLPEDRRKWKYNMNALELTRPLIHQFLDVYVRTYQSEPYKELQELLKENVACYKTVYGEGTIEYNRAQDFQDNKNEELYSILGNSLLREMSEHAKQFQEGQHFTRGSSSIDWSGKQPQQPGNQFPKEPNLQQLKKAFSKDFEHQKNQLIYMKNAREQERQNEQGLER